MSFNMETPADAAQCIMPQLQSFYHGLLLLKIWEATAASQVNDILFRKAKHRIYLTQILVSGITTPDMRIIDSYRSDSQVNQLDPVFRVFFESTFRPFSAGDILVQYSLNTVLGLQQGKATVFFFLVSLLNTFKFRSVESLPTHSHFFNFLTFFMDTGLDTDPLNLALRCIRSGAGEDTKQPYLTQPDIGS
jgi:hypothetical protein